MCNNMDFSAKRLLTDAKLPLIAAFNPKKATKMHKETVEGDMTDEAAIASQEKAANSQHRSLLNSQINVENARRNKNIKSSLLGMGTY